MNTFILTWNPVSWEWPAKEFDAAVRRTAKGQRSSDQWSVGARKQGIVKGDRAFLLRQHAERGLVASGYFTSPIFTAPHWDGSDRDTTYCKLEWDVVLKPDERLEVEDLKLEVPDVAWDRLQGSGVMVPAESGAMLERLWQDHLGGAPFRSNEEVAPGVAYHEGAVVRIVADRYERNRQARQKCLEHWGTRCQVCDLDFGERYGSIGMGFIHVHHLREISTIGDEHKVDPVNDLRPVCPNCHAMIHASRPALTIGALRKRLRG